MQVEVLKGGWIKQGSVIAFPYEWQRPAKTEEWVYETLIAEKVNSIFVEFISFPWATLIDLIAREKHERAKQLIAALNELPPKKTLVRATACQHINPSIVQEFLKKIKVTDLFWAHKVEEEDFIGPVRLHPMALYPVAYFEAREFEIKPISNRKYAYSFIGAYDPQGYISSIREEIFSLPMSNDAYILKRNHWHFENQVYKLQIEKEMLNDTEVADSISAMDEYVNVMLDSKLSLCPSGAGPNSIRLWEALAFNSYPLILSDQLDLPFNIIKSGFVKTQEDDLKIAVNQILDGKYEFRGSFLDSVDEFISNITHDLFSRDFISLR